VYLGPPCGAKDGQTGVARIPCVASGGDLRSGIYPFWIGGANLFDVTDEIGALTRSSHIRTIWSSLQNSARMEHEVCLLTKVSTT